MAPVDALLIPLGIVLEFVLFANLTPKKGETKANIPPPRHAPIEIARIPRQGPARTRRRF